MRHFLKIYGIFLALILVLGVTGCSTKQESVVVPTSSIQKAYLYDGDKQKELIQETIKLNRYTKYAYDSERHGGDHWNPTALEDVKQLKRDLESGVSLALKEKVPVDCEDTMFIMVQNLMNLGYPADQIWYTFYLTPPSKVTGGKSGWVGHAVTTVDVEGSIPYTLEQRSVPLSAKVLAENKNYYVVARCRVDKDITKDWKYVDREGYWAWADNRVDYNGAINTDNYTRYREYTNTIYRRKDFE